MGRWKQRLKWVWVGLVMITQAASKEHEVEAIEGNAACRPCPDLDQRAEQGEHRAGREDYDEDLRHE